jgi:murein L,D-transpeptidase YafK
LSAAQSQKTSSTETPPQREIVDQKAGKPDHPVASHPQGQERIETSAGAIEKRLTADSTAVVSSSVAEDRTAAEKRPAQEQTLSAESSIEDFVEKWRRSWEEGDVQAYINCYHPEFKARGMDIQEWENYKNDLFNRTPERDVQISDIKIDLDGALAKVTFKQRYQTKNYKGYGSKTLLLVNHQGNWSILDESYESLPAEIEPVEVEIQRFVENWRRSWEEGNLKTYIACYHPQFETEKMDFQDWKKHKRDLFARSAKRNVQISDMRIEPHGSSAVVTFKQRYQTVKHQDLGLKTLHMRRYRDNWTIFKEKWQPISGQG